MSRFRKSGWTAERRERQRLAIQSWKPWEKSTGPVTDAGKKAVSYNAYGARLSRLSASSLFATIKVDQTRD